MALGNMTVVPEPCHHDGGRMCRQLRLTNRSTPSVTASCKPAICSSTYLGIGAGPAIGGEVLRRVPRCGQGEGAAGAVGGEELDAAEVAVVAGNSHRRVAVVVGLVHRGVRSEQRRDDLGVAPHAGGI